MASANSMKRIADEPEFLRNVTFFAYKAAVAVMAEAAVTASHAARVVYAKAILGGTASMTDYASAVVSNATLQAEANHDAPPNFGIPDSDLEFTVNSLFNAMAGVSL